MRRRPHVLGAFLYVGIALGQAPLQGGETSSSVPVLRSLGTGPGASSRVCDGGDREMVCSAPFVTAEKVTASRAVPCRWLLS